MRNLKINVHISLSESEGERHTDQTIANSLMEEIIDSDVRTKLSNEELKQLFIQKTSELVKLVQKNLIKQINFPLTEDTNDQLKRHEEALENLFPGIKIRCYYNEGILKLYNFSKKVGPWIGIDIYHPLNPEQYLTTKYTTSFEKLNNGLWTYGYQCNYYYEGIVEIIPPPIDESLLDKYFKELSIEYKISTRTLLPLPEVELYEEREQYD